MYAPSDSYEPSREFEKRLSDASKSDVFSLICTNMEDLTGIVFGVENALGRRFQCEDDEFGQPLLTYGYDATLKAIDSSFAGVERKFKAERSNLLITFTKLEPELVSVEYVMPYKSKGQPAGAVILPTVYVPKNSRTRGGALRALSRTGPLTSARYLKTPTLIPETLAGSDPIIVSTRRTDSSYAYLTGRKGTV